MPRAYTTKGSRRISALIAVLLALLIWFVRDQIPVFPAGGKQAPRDELKLISPQVYYGPSNSIAVLPFSCTSPVFEDGPGIHPVKDWVADPVLAYGIAESLIELLAEIPGLQVTASNSSMWIPKAAPGAASCLTILIVAPFRCCLKVIPSRQPVILLNI